MGIKYRNIKTTWNKYLILALFKSIHTYHLTRQVKLKKQFVTYGCFYTDAILMEHDKFDVC